MTFFTTFFTTACPFSSARRAPEIYEEEPYSFKSDVWALGCVMYEVLTGKPAFGADNLSRVVIKVGRERGLAAKGGLCTLRGSAAFRTTQGPGDEHL